MLAFGSKAFIGFSIEQQRLDVRIGSVAAIGNSVRPMTGFGRVSSPGEFHPEALSEPYVNVSIHTAPIIQP